MIGLFSIIISVILIWKLLKGIWTCGLGYYLGFGVEWRPAPDSWAVVTGGTDGIGYEYAKQLAQKGYSVLILSRNEEKLKRIADKIKSQCPKCSEIKTLAVDFQRSDIYSNIEKVIHTLKHIDVLVNNVGMRYHKHEYFTNIPSQFNDSYVNVLILSYMKMCEIIIPKMINQKRGIIINISALMAHYAHPMFTVLAAAFGFRSLFTRGLAIEYAHYGITVQSVLPGLVSTKHIPMDIRQILPVKPNEYVFEALKTVGIEWETYGHWKHKIGALMFKISILIFGDKLTSIMALKCTRMSEVYEKYN